MTPNPDCDCKLNSGGRCLGNADCPKSQEKFVKADGGKVDWTLLPFDGLEGIVRAREYGVRKYGSRENWRLCDDPERYLKAAVRHIVAHLAGQTLDAESGNSHLDHAQCSLAFYQALIRKP